MKKHWYSIALTCLIIVFIILAYELIRSTFFKEGDFKGYLEAGNLVLSGKDIYLNPRINTWLPFFSILSVPLSLVGNISAPLVRFLWMACTVGAVFFIIHHLTTGFLNRRLVWIPKRKEPLISDTIIALLHPVVLVPLLIAMRYIMDNMANLQINIFMLLLALLSIRYFAQKKEGLAGFLLALSISIKVYTIFLLFYFIVKREFKTAGYTVLFLILMAALPFLVFGIETTLQYYETWYANNVEPFASVGHKNQSFFSMMRSLLMHESPGINQPLNMEIYLNIFHLDLISTRWISYLIVVILGVVGVWFMGEKITERQHAKTYLGFVFILTIIPLLSPLAWKGYFIFLWPAWFVQYILLFRVDTGLPDRTRGVLKILFLMAVAMTVFSSELFIGKHLSRLLEAFSVITIGTILAAVVQFILYCRLDGKKLSNALLNINSS